MTNSNDNEGGLCATIHILPTRVSSSPVCGLEYPYLGFGVGVVRSEMLYLTEAQYRRVCKACKAVSP